MNAAEKLQDVNNNLLRILALIPEYSNVGWRNPVKDIQEGIVKFLRFENENTSLAEEFSEPGTLKRYLLKKGFMPDNEVRAEAILDGIIRENEQRM